MNTREIKIKLFFIYGILYEAMIALVVPLMPKFLERVGGNASDIVYLNASKGIVMVLVVLPSIYFMRRYSSINKIIDRILKFMIFALMMISISSFVEGSFAPYAFIAAAALFNGPLSTYNVAYQEFTGDLFEAGRARIIAKRTTYVVILVSALNILTGVLFKTLSGFNISNVVIFRWIYIISILILIAGLFVFKKFDKIQIESYDKEEFLGVIKNAFKNKKFKAFTISSFLFYVGWTMGWPLFSIYSINVLKADELWLSIMGACLAIAQYISLRFWPSVIEKRGEPFVAAICTFGMSITPLFYAASTSLRHLMYVSLIVGFFTSGTITVLFVDLLASVPKEKKLIYIALYNTIVNIPLAISPFIGLYFTKAFSIKVALIVTSGFRFLGSAAFFIRRRRG